MTTQPAPPGARRRVLLLVALAIVAVVVLVGAVVLSGSGRSTMTGIVLRVDSVSLTDVRGFDLRTSDGRVVTFELGTLDITPPAFNAQHLVVHQATAEPVRVEYEVRDGKYVAVRLTDAD